MFNSLKVLSFLLSINFLLNECLSQDYGLHDVDDDSDDDPFKHEWEEDLNKELNKEADAPLPPPPHPPVADHHYPGYEHKSRSELDEPEDMELR